MHRRPARPPPMCTFSDEEDSGDNITLAALASEATRRAKRCPSSISPGTPASAAAAASTQFGEPKDPLAADASSSLAAAHSAGGAAVTWCAAISTQFYFFAEEAPSRCARPSDSSLRRDLSGGPAKSALHKRRAGVDSVAPATKRPRLMNEAAGAAAAAVDPHAVALALAAELEEDSEEENSLPEFDLALEVSSVDSDFVLEFEGSAQ